RATIIQSLTSKPESFDVYNNLINGIKKSLKERFAKLPSLGKVYLDPQLRECPVPSQQRSASKGLFSVARGTRLPFDSRENALGRLSNCEFGFSSSKTANTLRFFIYWIGQDIDLSASLHDAN